jgi:NADPH-dependent 2,4-dienoyl-CoA reductase/sulfur reductase-like enzyme
MTCDLAIVGAGPAGMAAATQAAALGLDTIVLDAQPEPGGQMYRAIGSADRHRRGEISTFGAEYSEGAALVGSFRASGSAYQPCSVAWQVRADGCVGISCNGASRMLAARRVLIATGAMERPVPVPGWTLPGVMSAGGAQTLLKGSGIVPDGPVVLVGSGPLLSLITAQLARAGVPIAALLLMVPEVGATEPGLGVLTIQGVAQPVIEGAAAAHAVSYTHDGKRHRIEAALVLLHNGLIPCTQLSRGAGCKQMWNGQQRCWQPQTDEWGATDLERIAIAGDAAGILATPAALCHGRLAALDAAMRLGKLSQTQRDQMAQAARLELAHYRAANDPRGPAAELLAPSGPDDIVCRCESVTVRELHEAIAQGSSEINRMKAFTRCGMGLCQGRLCGPVAAEVIARALGQGADRVGQFRVRLPVHPLPLAELAGLR